MAKVTKKELLRRFLADPLNKEKRDAVRMAYPRYVPQAEINETLRKIKNG